MLILEQRFRNTSSKPKMTEEVSKKLNGVIESQHGEIYRALAGDEQLRRTQQLLHEQLPEQNRDLCEAHMKSLNEMEELQRFQGSTLAILAPAPAAVLAPASTTALAPASSAS